MDWVKISKESGLTEAFIREHKNNLDWKLLSQYQSLSETLINQYRKKFSWAKISKYQTLSLSFIEKNKMFIYFKDLKINSNCSFSKEEWEQIDRWSREKNSAIKTRQFFFRKNQKKIMKKRKK